MGRVVADQATNAVWLVFLCYPTREMREHRFAILAAIATFTLLVIGGTVNPTGSSLACPEPTLVCHGQLFPPMKGGVLYEHGHRLAAMTVGMLQIVLTLLLVRRRRDAKGLAWTLLAMVILQGTLGAITVKYKLPWFVSTGHLMLGMSYFATLLYTVLRTRAARSVLQLDVQRRLLTELGTGRRWIVFAAGATAVQLFLGALVRHLGAAQVCLGMPECTRSGDWWPAAHVQQLHMVHRGMGIAVAAITLVTSIVVARRARNWPALRKLVLVAPVIAAAQVTLGIYVVLTMRAVPLAVGHFAGATALWAVWVAAWLLTAPRRTVAQGVAHTPLAGEVAPA